MLVCAVLAMVNVRRPWKEGGLGEVVGWLLV